MIETRLPFEIFSSLKMYIYLSKTWSVWIINLYLFLYVWLALWRIIACLSFKWLWRHFVDPVVFNKAEQCIHLPCPVFRLSKKWFHTSDRLVIETSSNPPTSSWSYPVSCSNWKNFFGGEERNFFPKKQIWNLLINNIH